MTMILIRGSSLPLAPAIIVLLYACWAIAPVAARVGGGGGSGVYQTAPLKWKAAVSSAATKANNDQSSSSLSTYSYYPIRERNARETTKEISVDELDEFMLTFSFDSAPKVLRPFFLDLYLTDGFLPTSPSIHTVEQAFSNFALPELNAHYGVFHTVMEVNVTILAQQSIVTSSHLDDGSTSDSPQRLLQTLGSELETQVSVVFRNEPSPRVSNVEDTLAEILKDDEAMLNFISNLTALAQGDVELAAVTHAEARSVDDATRESGGGGGGEDTADPIKEVEQPPSTATPERGAMIEVIIPVVAAGCLTMAVIAVFVTRRQSSKQHNMIMEQQRQHVVSTQIGGQMVASSYSAGGGGGGVPDTISSVSCTPQHHQLVNVFMADAEDSDVFSFEAALASTSPNYAMSPNISRLSMASSNRSASGTVTSSCCEEDGSDVFSGVGDSEMTSPRESRSVFSFLSGYKSEASTVVASNTTKAKGELDDTVALATFKASISPKAAAKLSKQETTPTSNSANKHSLFTFSEEDEGDLDEENDDEMEPLVVTSEQSLNAKEQQYDIATVDEPSPRSGTPINSEEAAGSGGAGAGAAIAAMGLTSLLNSHSSSSDDSASTEEHTATVNVGVGAISHNAIASEPIQHENKKTAPPPPAVAVSPKRSGFAAFFTSKKPDAVKTAAAQEPAVSPNSLKDKASPPAPTKTSFIKASSAPWGACSKKATATIAPSPKLGEATPSSAWYMERAPGYDASVDSESLGDYSVQHSSDDEESNVQRQSITSSEAAVDLESAMLAPKADDDSVLSSPVVYTQQARAESKTEWNNPGYESDPGPRGKSPKKTNISNQTQPADDANVNVDGSRLEKVDLQWDNPLQASINAKVANEFVGWTSTTTSDDTTPSWKKLAREHAKSSAAVDGPSSPEYPSPADFDSPGGRRGKGRRHAKSTTADGSTDYQAETMQQRDESLATFDAVSLSDSESAGTRDEALSSPVSPTMPLFSQEDHLVDHSMFSEDSRASSEASASRQLLSDLVWLEKKIAGVASSTASPMSEPKAKETHQQPSTIDHSDSLSFASGDGTCTSSLHEERKKLAGQAPPSSLLPASEPPTTMSSIVCRDCYAPPGKLRIVIHSTKDGPAVHTVKKDSSLEGHVFPGDLIISVDNVDTRSYTAEQVMKMMTARTTYERKITVLHFDTPNLKSP